MGYVLWMDNRNPAAFATRRLFHTLLVFLWLRVANMDGVMVLVLR